MIPTAVQVGLAAGLGGMAGLLGGLFGVGGGFLVIPLLGFFYGVDQQTAQGTALIMVVPNVVWAFSRYRRLFGIDLRMAATIAGSALITTYPTAHLATHLDPHVLRLAFAVFLATIAATIAYRTWRGGTTVGPRPTRAWGWITVVGVIGGAFSGFFGVGGAFVAPPLLTTFFGFRQLESQGLALALVSPSALVALLAYAEADQVDWFVGLPLALGGIAAISAGVKFASRLPERRMRLAFCGLLLLTAVLLALRG
ncbi:MAG: sulfite exporter TauE/SafE family protein [Alphaproteobacteria bacterium]|nr:sulfite exporter TauE/SafE family protein [Alphaproteobacteria bacterium]